ncbi:hypothetical protein [Mycobacterium innocens]|uniref:hypothetical protein n=1 Tax=Mycobacterium innocens TaxID=2341083 RepID=UPI000A6E7730|nr:MULTISPECIES: hypothetical protein [Mycobacterium]
MPATEPGPLGFCLAYSEQPVPIRSAAGSAIADVDAGAAMLVGALLLVDGPLADLLLEQAAKPPIAIAARLVAATVLAQAFIMCVSTPS